MLADMAKRFSKEAPVAMMFHGLFSRLFSAERLDQIFVDHAKRQVQGTLLFSKLV